MALKVYEEENIRSIADALRLKLGETKVVNNQTVKAVVHSANAYGHDTCPISNQRPTASDTFSKCLHVPGTKMFVVCLTGAGNIEAYFMPQWADVSSTASKVFPNDYSYGTYTRLAGTMKRKILVFKDTEYLTYHMWAKTTGNYGADGYYLQICALDDAGNAIEFSGTTNTTMTMEVPNLYKTYEMAAAINSIGADSADTTLITKEVTENGTYAAASDGAYGYGTVIVDVHDKHTDKEFTENGVYYPSYDGVDGYGVVTVNVQHVPMLQEKTEYFNESGHKLVTADEGYDGLKSVDVTVNVSASGDTIGFNMDMSKMAVVKNYYWYTCWDTESDSASTGWDISTKEVKPSSTGRYAWYAANDVQVGDNIMEHLQSYSMSKYNYTRGYYYEQNSSSAPTRMDQMCMTGSDGSAYIYYKTWGVELTNHAATTSFGDLVIINGLGTVLFRGSFPDGVDAINNKTIDIRDGFWFLTTEVATSGSSGADKNTIKVYMKPHD